MMIKFFRLLEDFEAAENGLDPGPVMHKPPPTLSFPHVPILPSLPKPLPLFKKPSIPTTFSLTFSSPLETKTSGMYSTHQSGRPIIELP